MTTSEITNITGKDAVCGGTIIDEGTSSIVARGVCWSRNLTPTIADNKTSEGAGADTSRLYSPNTGAPNESGFSALPGTRYGASG